MIVSGTGTTPAPFWRMAGYNPPMPSAQSASAKRVAQLTRGSLPRSIFNLAMPSMVAHIFVLGMDLWDGVLIGRLSSTHLAAVTLAWAIIFFLATLGSGFGVGTVAVVSRAFGEGRFDKAGRAAGQALLLGTLAGIVVGGVGILSSSTLLRLLGATGEIQVIGKAYLMILFGGLFLMFFMFIGASVFQGAGDAVTPMWIAALALVLNAVLDPLLIFGLLGFPRMEAAGAAVATVVSRLIACVPMIVILARGNRGIRIAARDLTPDPALMKAIFMIGLPGTAQMLIRSTSNLLITKIAAYLGPVTIAVIGGGGRLFGLFLFPGFAFGAAAATIVGQNLGARKPERAERGALLSAGYYLILLATCGLPVFVFAPQLARMFNEEPEFIRICTVFFRFMSVGSLTLAGGLVMSRALQGAGETVWPMIVTAVALLAIQVPLAYLLGVRMGIGPTGIWIANLAGGIVNAVLVMAVFFKGGWKHKRI